MELCEMAYIWLSNSTLKSFIYWLKEELDWSEVINF